MPDYCYFGLRLSAPVLFDSIPILEFARSDCDVNVRFGPVPARLDGVIFRSSQLEIDQNKSLLLREDQIENSFISEKPVGSCLVRNGSEVLFQARNRIDARWIQFLMLTVVASTLLYQRGMLPLQASTVVFKGKVITICGPSGRGKSSLAAMIIKAGGALVSEDISVIAFEDGTPYVPIGPQGIKLFPDDARAIGISHLHGPVAPTHQKLLWNQPQIISNTMQRLSAVVLLEIENEKNSVGISKLESIPLDALFDVNIGYHMGCLEPLYQGLQKIPRLVPTYRLIRPNDMEKRHVMLDMLEQLARLV